MPPTQANKALPQPPPARRRWMQIGKSQKSPATPGPSKRDPSSSESGSSSDESTARIREQLAQYFPAPAENNEQEISSDSGDESQNAKQLPAASLRDLTFRKTPREILLERRLSRISIQNTTLMHRLKIAETRDSREKDEIISLLRQQTKRYDQHISSQNQLMTRLAQTIRAVFEEHLGQELEAPESPTSLYSDNPELEMHGGRSYFSRDSESDL
ncbi:hypothetical protein F5Y15DRAFT_379245 [Xylariaceae sp. FL0016]|nr:hypothetical protein F5Y15DRAFT_379245 [Xylariaceae sp. FL0016]